MGLAKLLEQVRLRAHFRQVLAELRARDVGHLAAPERAERERVIVELERYARRGRFPVNRDFADRRMPYFVDASGTRCAVAHLIDSTGERELVERVRRTRNNGFVRELAPDRALQAWLRAAGLTVAEAARIQPSYCFVTKAEACFCSDAYASDGVVIATATDQTLDSVLARIDTLHGNTGALTVGQSITVSASTGAHPGDALLVPVYVNQGTAMFETPFRLDGDSVILACDLDVPALKKADAIAAILTTDSASCAMHLADVDDTWGESQCDDMPGNPDDGGCRVAGDGTPLAIGAALAAALWARRRPLRAR